MVADPGGRCGLSPRMAVRRTPDTPGFFMAFALTGELDTSSIPTLCDATSEVLAEGSRHLIMDLSAVTRCDNATFYTLLGMRDAIHQAGGSLTLANPSRCVETALSRSAVRDQLPLRDIPASSPPYRYPAARAKSPAR
ncbi:STAS domain-containing protein [Streptomyces sp. NPDC016845]|uniref:STAS domain-containing protein n=1 Tax=Streptomyces sp. NPDC016845 TaxID=3364972 RepID=UPI0037B05692